MFYSEDRVFLARAQWRLKISIWPRRCEVSGRSIWLRHAYRGVATWTGPGDPVHEVKWISVEEFLFGKIAGKI